MSHVYLYDVIDDVSQEADRARREFGDQFDLTPLQWFAVLAEEFGEVARDVTTTEVPPVAVYKESSADLRAELLQVAAVACRWIRALDTHQS